MPLWKQEAYDGEESTYVQGRSVVYYINISPEMVGKNLKFIGKAILQEYSSEALQFDFINKNDEVIESKVFSNTTNPYRGSIYISEEAIRIKINFLQGSNRNGKTAPFLYEIMPYDTPVITETKYYPIYNYI